MPEHTTTRRYDIQGMGNLRVFRVVLLWKLLRLDDISGKPKLRDVLDLTVRHYLGGQLAIITLKHEKQWLRFLQNFRRKKAVVFKRAGLIRDKLLGRL